MKNLPVIPIDMCLRKLISTPPLHTEAILYRYGYREFYRTGGINLAYVIMEWWLTNECTSAIINKIYKDCEEYSKNNPTNSYQN